jgi:hypothetical protein
MGGLSLGQDLERGAAPPGQHEQPRGDPLTQDFFRRPAHAGSRLAGSNHDDVGKSIQVKMMRADREMVPLQSQVFVYKQEWIDGSQGGTEYL